MAPERPPLRAIDDAELEVRLREARKALAAAVRDAEALERQRDSAGRAHEKARATLDAARARRRNLG